MTIKVGSPTVSASSPPAAQSAVSKAIQTAHMTAKRALNVATSPLAAYFAVSTCVVVFGADLSFLRGTAVNLMAHTVAIPSALVYATYLRSRQINAKEQPLTVKTESSVVEITQQNYKKEVLESNLPVILDAYTDWCPPCKAMAPILSELSNEMKGKFKFVKCNVEKQPEIAKELKIEAMPTFVYFKGGKIVDRHVGAMPKADMLAKCIQLFV